MPGDGVRRGVRLGRTVILAEGRGSKIGLVLFALGWLMYGSLLGRIADLAAGRWGCAGDSGGGCVAKIDAQASISACDGLLMS